MKKRPIENQEQIDLLKQQVMDLEPGSEEQQRAVKSLCELQGSAREAKKGFRDWIGTVCTVGGTVGTLVMSWLMFQKPYRMQEKNVYVTDRNGQDNIKEAKSNVKDTLKKLTR